MATPDTLNAPPGHEAGPQQAGADVLPFPPHLTDGDFFDPGYTLVPAREQGSFFSPNRLARFQLGVTVGLGKAALDVACHYSENIIDIGGKPERRFFEVDGAERVALVTEPDPATDVNPEEAVNEILVLGLSEMDIGSGLLFHKAKAKRHPERRIVSLTTPGVDLTGETLSVAEGFDRSLDVTAAENMKIAREIAGDNPANISAVSMGTFITMRMAAKNLVAGRKSMVNLDRLELTSPAIGARNVPETERFQELDAADKELIDKATDEFFRHMPGNIWEIAKTHPEKAAQCGAVVMAYLLEPHKLVNRGAAIAGNLRSVQEGIEWEDMKAVAQTYPMHILGGELDPLMQQQLAQWLAVKEAAPTTRIRLMQGLGHAMTVDAPGAVEQLGHMEQESAGLALAA
jgi:pimeloyl-ACP methyl ester carboxylesterase